MHPAGHSGSLTYVLHRPFFKRNLALDRWRVTPSEMALKQTAYIQFVAETIQDLTDVTSPKLIGWLLRKQSHVYEVPGCYNRPLSQELFVEFSP